MGIDASIIAGLRPVQIQQPQDPLDRANKELAYKSLVQQGQMQQQGIEDDAAQRAALTSSGGDNARYRALLMDRGQYKAVQALDKAATDQRAKEAETKKNEAAAGKSTNEDALKKLEHGAALLDGVTDQASYDRAKRVGAITGTFPAEALAKFPEQYDPQFVASMKQAGVTRAQQLTAQNQTGTLAQTTARDTAAHADRVEANRIAAAKNPTSDFAGDNGKLMAALAERGVALPAGFRSRAQQVALLEGLRSRNPDASVDQIAEKVRGGQIDLGNEKTWGRVAAGIGGKVAYAENEIKQTIPLVREASAKLPRGEFIPFNKLQQMGQEAFSNPDLAEFRMYMTSLSNAYDMLAARGGTDMEKRKENRKNFETAQSAEALERVMQAVMKEAQASGRAAQSSLRVPGSDHTPAPIPTTPGTPPSAPGWGIVR